MSDILDQELRAYIFKEGTDKILKGGLILMVGGTAMALCGNRGMSILSGACFIGGIVGAVFGFGKILDGVELVNAVTTA